MYLLLGDGRLSRHLAKYFELSGISFDSWNRKIQDPEKALQERLKKSQTVLFLVSDDQIVSLKKQYESFWGERTLVHCSGALVVNNMESAHPLFSFSADRFCDLMTYESIPFITETGKKPLRKLIPEIPNRSFEIDPRIKPLYHALCVVSGNFTQILWSEVSERFSQKLKLSPDLLLPYMESVFLSLKHTPGKALTGPLARKDTGTIRSNLRALEGDELQEIYRAFMELFDIP